MGVVRVVVDDIGEIQDCMAENSQMHGIEVGPTGKAAISGTKVRNNQDAGLQVRGEATIKDSSITANRLDGVLACKQGENEEGKGIVTVGENVECSGNNTGNHHGCSDYTALADGTFVGLPRERILVSA